jgi:5-methylcytosine-specific restriction protein A
VHDGTGRCAAHPRASWLKRPDAAKRITGRKLQKLRDALFKREPLCAECNRLGRVTLATQRDHIIALEDGGEDVESNVQGLCDDCHDVKSREERRRGLIRSRG